MSKHYTVQRYFRNEDFGTSIMQNSTVILTHYSNMKITDQYIFQSTLFAFDFITKYLPYSFEQMFRFNHGIANSRATRQFHLLNETRCKTHFTNELPLYAIPKMRNTWFHTLPQNMPRSKFKYVLKANKLSSYPSQVTCSNSFCQDCFISS